MSFFLNYVWRILIGVTLFAGLIPAIEHGEALAGDLVLMRSTATQLDGSLTSKSAKFEVSVTGNASKSARVTITLPKKTFSVEYKPSPVQEFSLGKILVVATNSDDKQKSQYDDQVLRSLLAALPRTPAQEANYLPLSMLRQTIELFVDMVPIGEKFDVIEKSSRQSTPKPSSYTSICRARGKLWRGVFDGDDGSRFLRQSVVGDPATLCVGRCGPGCDGISRKPLVYTQDCFNHDLCTGHYGEWFGNCSDEWWSAADDFMFGPNCSLYVVGNWQLYFDWANGGGGSTPLYIYNSGTFATDDGGIGVWFLNGNNLVLRFTVGCSPIYSGAVSNNNLIANGTMACTTSSGSGTWQASYEAADPNAASKSSARGASTGLSSSGIPK